jgi:hypothetical protein
LILLLFINIIGGWEDVVREDSIKVLGTKAWKIKAKDRQFWTQRIEEAKAPYGL